MKPNNKKDIQKQFYKIYKGHISVSEFEEWLYDAQEIGSIYGDDFYFILLDLNYKNKHIKNDIERHLEREIPF
ncbi:hypothetical protein WAK64_08085 [Bacillus spongiae]|uniref:Uncharacterized protein n=1 Tax=Bacillus spongiae TaxID=2683610 RepID=A0ABU8HCD5_9BACI